jgi:hypothetical protein
MIFHYFAKSWNTYGQCSIPFLQPALCDGSSSAPIGLKPKRKIKNYPFPAMFTMTGIHIILQTVSPLLKTLVPLKHSTVPKASLLYTCFIMLNVSLVDLPSFWQNLTFAHCSNCHIFNFCHLHLTAVHNRGCSSTCTVCTQLPLAVMRDELTGHHIVPQPICCSALQPRFAASP